MHVHSRAGQVAVVWLHFQQLRIVAIPAPAAEGGSMRTPAPLSWTDFTASRTVPPTDLIDYRPEKG
jgi:hypothetical protein